MADTVTPVPEPRVFEDIEQEKQPSEKVQTGVQLAEAVTLSWTKKSLVVVYVW
jgi:hypothetical protein